MRLLRPRFTILTLMMVVAISAIGITWFRPISQAEAERIAEAKFLRIPGASRWVGLYRIEAGYEGAFDTDQAKRYGDSWTVVVSDPKDGFPVMQMFLMPKGRTRAVDFVPGKFNEIASSGFSAKELFQKQGFGLEISGKTGRFPIFEIVPNEP